MLKTFEIFKCLIFEFYKNIKIKRQNMEAILTDAEYKNVINRIAALTNTMSELNLSNNLLELNNLRRMAINYELTKYDLTLRINQDYAWSVAG
ncbi:hypothetical protein ASG14_15365 [Pedobacter sp. Leaf194]|nr:hypothetical protein ASG14_15365 [Pedobacter sp. Leaf194]